MDSLGLGAAEIGGIVAITLLLAQAVNKLIPAALAKRKNGNGNGVSTDYAAIRAAADAMRDQILTKISDNSIRQTAILESHTGILERIEDAIRRRS